MVIVSQDGRSFRPSSAASAASTPGGGGGGSSKTKQLKFDPAALSTGMFFAAPFLSPKLSGKKKKAAAAAKENDSKSSLLVSFVQFPSFFPVEVQNHRTWQVPSWFVVVLARVGSTARG